MKKTIVTVSFLFCLLTVGAAHERPRDAACDKVKQEIRRIHSRMRAGYSARTGIRLAARLRELQRQRARVCR